MTSRDIKELEEMSPEELAKDWTKLAQIKSALGALYRRQREEPLSDTDADLLHRLEQLSEHVAANWP